MRRRNLDCWLGDYIRQIPKRRAPRPGHPVHVLLCIADHFEPQHGKVVPAVARSRINRWVNNYPRLFYRFRDSDGRPPQHTFFYPLEQYHPKEVESLAELCRAGYGEVEV